MVLLVRLIDALYGVVYGTQVTAHAETGLRHQHAHVQVHLGPSVGSGWPSVRRADATAADSDAHALVLPPATADYTAAGPAAVLLTAAAFGPDGRGVCPTDGRPPRRWRVPAAAAHQQEEGDGHSKPGRPPHVRLYGWA